MRRVMGVVVLAAVMFAGCAGMQTQDGAASVFKVMEDVQQNVTWQVWNANGWAGSPIVVDAVLAQNKKGPIAGMDNKKWKTVPENDAIVQGFINNEAAKFLKAETAKTDGTCVGFFLNGAQGEKVAFSDKTGGYIHKGSAKFDVPFTTGKAWQGKPELEDKIYVIQISVPVLSEGKPIGVLVVEIDGSKLEALAKK
ncbi:MAG: PDC sensor domain-containing protein [Syntrophales bacterium]